MDDPESQFFYIAHLSEPERQFIITLLTENMLGWMRTLSGTTSLRALLYIDEMFGYFPPHPYNPPTKDPILRLLKQARAFGIGLVLATQNPGDLDYKGLTNAGTWFIGRLQSQNDQKRVMAGLESLATADNGFDLQEVGRLIADIDPRVFLMHNVHDTGGPLLLHTRWAMSYLRGPLTRQQVGILMQHQRQELMQQLAANGNQHQGGYRQQTGAAPAAPPPPPSLPGQMIQAPASVPGFAAQNAPQTPAPVAQPRTQGPAGFSATQPAIPSSIEQYFLPHSLNTQQALGLWQQQTQFAIQSANGGVLAYRPVLLAQAAVRYQDRKANIFTAPLLQLPHRRSPRGQAWFTGISTPPTRWTRAVWHMSRLVTPFTATQRRG